MPRGSQRGQVIPVESPSLRGPVFHVHRKTPPAAKLILKAAGLQKGSGNPLQPVGKISKAQVGRDRRDEDGRRMPTTSTRP